MYRLGRTGRVHKDLLHTYSHPHGTEEALTVGQAMLHFPLARDARRMDAWATQIAEFMVMPTARPGKPLRGH
jgi:hypothetical protein